MLVKFPLIVFLVPLLTYAGTDDRIDCSDYYGLNICAAGFELSNDKKTYPEQKQSKFIPKMEEHAPLFGTSLTTEDMDQIKRENTFKNTDSFRAYMKTIGTSASTSTDSEFSLKKRILDKNNYGLDCRLVTTTLSEISNSNYYDCAVQRYF
jgi:hypothetical protein